MVSELGWLMVLPHRRGVIGHRQRVVCAQSQQQFVALRWYFAGHTVAGLVGVGQRFLGLGATSGRVVFARLVVDFAVYRSPIGRCRQAQSRHCHGHVGYIGHLGLQLV